MTDASNAQENSYTSQGVVAGSIPLFAGHPAHELLPVAGIQDRLNTLFRQPDIYRMFNYGDEQGDSDLINFLVERFNQYEELNISSDNLMIIAGSTGGVTMITHYLTQPHDTILVDAPSYRDALHIFRDQHLNIQSIPIDEGGIIIPEMEQALAKLQSQNKIPKFYYVVPTFQNPTGITLSTERRHAIIRLSQQYNFTIVEDDVYSEIRFVDEIPPSFYQLAGGRNVLRLGTFSKTLSPGLRLGWLIGDEVIIKRFVNSGTLKMGGGANPFTAKLVADYCQSGAWNKHILWLREQYQARRDIVLNALREHMPASVKWTQPDGGYFIWVTLPDTVHVTNLEQVANTNGVYFASGRGFFVNSDEENHTLRLSYSYVTPSDMQKGIATLGRLIDDMIG